MNKVKNVRCKPPRAQKRKALEAPAAPATLPMALDRNFVEPILSAGRSIVTRFSGKVVANLGSCIFATTAASFYQLAAIRHPLTEGHEQT